LDILVDEHEGSLWVATVKDRKLTGLEIDPYEEEVRYGTIYWAQVIRIDKSLDAAFVNLDGENTGILHNADILVDGKRGGKDAIGKHLQAGDLITVQAKNGYLPREDSTDITMEDKSARVSMNITIPGRYLIYCPMMQEKRISRRITDKKQRKQLTKMLNSVENIDGCILRASAAFVQTDILIRESKILKEIWDQIQEFMQGDEIGPIMLGPDALQRTLSDQADKSIKTIDIVTMERYQDVEEWCEIYAPDLVTKVTPVELPDKNLELGLFDFRDILDQIDVLFQPYVIMNGGGNIIIEETVALTSIDINRGSDKRSSQTINLEAIQEIGKQIRLRNIGGIIIIDLLKTKTKKEREALIEALKEIAAHDPCTVQIHGITALGLAEVTRKQRTPSLQDRIDTTLM
jgi:Rne/Rng family ribonuclease